MGNLFYVSNFVAAPQGNAQSMLGKFLYFSLLNLLMEKTQLSELCKGMGISYSGGTRPSMADAFRSTTKDIKEHKPVTAVDRTNIYLVYYQDSKRTADALSRELMRETLNQKTNRYEKLANITCDRKDGQIYCTNIVMDPDIGMQVRCRQAEELSGLYQWCANRKQIETICVDFLQGMKATKLGINRRLYFVPRSYVEKVDIFEDFIRLLGGMNRNSAPLVVNSFYIIDGEKQRNKVAKGFCNTVKREIAEYQKRCDYLIKSGCQSPVVMERWVLRVRGLEEHKHHCEETLRQELNRLGEEFSTLKLLSQKLQVRANAIHL